MGEGFWCLRVSLFVKPRISRGMCKHRDNTAGMMRRGLVTVGTFTPPSTGGKRLLLCAESWVGLSQDGPEQLWEQCCTHLCQLAESKDMERSELGHKCQGRNRTPLFFSQVCLTATGYSKRLINLGLWLINKM